MNNKDRDISAIEYLNNLQVEYFECELRSRIYPYHGDKKYYKKVKGYKELKLRDLSKTKGIPNMLEDTEAFNESRNKVYLDEGFPALKNTTAKDVIHYYREESAVRVVVDGKILVGEITDTIFRLCVWRKDIPMVEKSSVEGDFIYLYEDDKWYKFTDGAIDTENEISFSVKEELRKNFIRVKIKGESKTKLFKCEKVTRIL